MGEHETSARNLEMIALYKTGKTMEEIGTQYGISRQRICQVFKRHGVSTEGARRGRKPTDPAKLAAYAQEAINSGSKKVAAEKFGVSVDTIGRALRFSGISLRSTKFTSDETRSDIVKRYLQGERLRVIAESYGTRPQHINSLLRKWGVEPQGWSRGTK